jgi:hypothetical protein
MDAMCVLRLPTCGRRGDQILRRVERHQIAEKLSRRGFSGIFQRVPPAGTRTELQWRACRSFEFFVQ